MIPHPALHAPKFFTSFFASKLSAPALSFKILPLNCTSQYRCGLRRKSPLKPQMKNHFIRAVLAKIS